MNAIELIELPFRPFRTACSVPTDLESVSERGDEVPARELGLDAVAVDKVWGRIEALYRTGLYPAVQVCIRRHGAVALEGALGHAAGNAPDDPPEGPKTRAGIRTPFTIYSASKAITAMVIHKLDEQGLIRLDDRVCDYIPEFGVHGKERITIRHVLGHRAGIPNLPSEALDLALLESPAAVNRLLCDSRPTSVPGRRLAYHAISGGFVLAELAERVTGHDIREILTKEIREPLGFRWMNYGVDPADVSRVALNAFTGFPPIPPFSGLLERALGVDLHRAVELSNDPRFLTGIIPSANIVATANELSAFYQCLLDEGEYQGVRVFDPRTIHRATLEQTFLEIDLTLGLPLPYGLGFMLGGWPIGLFGPDTPHAFGHLGFTNILSWADPEREIAVALITSGKPFLSPEVIRLVQVIAEIARAFPKVS